MSNRKIAYVRCSDRKYEKKSEKLRESFRKKFVKVSVETVDNGIIVDVPRYKEYNKKKIAILVRQIKQYIDEYEVNYLAFSNGLEMMRKEFDGCDILDGKALMKDSLINIFNYIFEVNNKNMSVENVHIFVNNYTNYNVYIIKKLVEKFKTVNIITRNLRYYKRLEESLYNEGILITVSNNKRKSARNARYIVNVDYDKEDFQQYCIYNHAIVVNLTKENKITGESFGGVLVNNFEISINKFFNIFQNTSKQKSKVFRNF